MTTTKVRKVTARQKLELSRLHLTQLELMGEDEYVEHLKLRIGKKYGLDIAEAITDATIERTIEGASTLTIVIKDRDRKLLKSGKLTARSDVKIDGLWFRLVALDKQDDTLTLTFEDREIAVLRTYFKIIKATAATSRSKITRAQFILRLIREVKEFKIPWVIPELAQSQPIEEDIQNTKTYGGNSLVSQNRGKGIPHGAGLATGGAPRSTAHQYARPSQPGLQVKGRPMTDSQIDVANAVLDTGSSQGCTRAMLVMSMMCAIQESTLANLKGGDRDSVGVFQQRHSQGWPASRNIARDATAFFNSLKGSMTRHPNYDYGEHVQDVQNSAFPKAYDQWKGEAEHIVSMYGESPNLAAENAMGTSPATQGDYEFYRGVPPPLGLKQWEHENSWTCIQRLSDEVNWRAFFVSGRFYYISETELMLSKPAAIITESKKGIESINGNYDEGHKSAELTVTCRMSRWSAPPGSIIVVREMGPMNGRYLVNNVKRSLFESLGTITLKKPRPKLPEPIGDTTGQKAAKQDASPFTGFPTAPPTSVAVSGGDAAGAAKAILQYHNQGRFRDDNGQQIKQLKKIAAGQKLHNQCGKAITMNVAPLNGILALLEAGLWVGTFAICEDHSCNAGQHPKGQAIDISSLGGGTGDTPFGSLVGWHSLNTRSSEGTALAKRAMRILAPTAWDLICNGIGGYDRSVQALQVDNGHQKGGVWESDHTNHIHYGAAPGRGAEDRHG